VYHEAEAGRYTSWNQIREAFLASMSSFDTSIAASTDTVRPSSFDSYSRNVRNHVVAHIGTVRLTKVDAGVLNGLYAHLLTSRRCQPSRNGKGYSPEVVERATELHADGLSLEETAQQLRIEFVEAEHITKNTVATLGRRPSTASPARSRPGLDG